MSKANVRVVEEFIEQIFNRKQLDRLADLCSKDAVSHAPPYVGLGVDFDDTSGRKLILEQIARNGPAYGRLQLGDELVRVKREDHIWETFDTLRKGLWARGLAGTEIALTVWRHGNLITIPLKLGQVEAFDIRIGEFLRSTVSFLKQYWPDLKVDIRTIFGSGDMVACYLINQGTNLEYNRTAVWSEMDLFRLEAGKIVEMWSVENAFDMMTQLGYQVTEPVRELA